MIHIEYILRKKSVQYSFYYDVTIQQPQPVKGYLTCHSHSVTNLRYTNAVDKKPHREEEEVEMARAPPKEGP